MLAKTKVLLAQPIISLVLLALVLGLGVTIAQATLSSTSDVISPPAVIDKDSDKPNNTHQQAFEERQRVLLQNDVSCTEGAAHAGETVNSHLIFYNTQFSSPEVDAERVWEFDEEIICVMSERSGLKQALTDGSLGASHTTYPGPFDGRGMENDGSDFYVVDGNRITVTMTSEPTGDSIRVLTRVVEPDDTTPPVVYCELGTNPGGKSQENKDDGKGNDTSKFLVLVGADDIDGVVDLYIEDNESGMEFGPFEPGTQVQIVTAKGATPKQEAGSGVVDYKIKVNGATTISATDKALNTGKMSCSE